MTVWKGEWIGNPHVHLQIDVCHSPTRHGAAGCHYNSLVLAASDAVVGRDKEGYSHLKNWRYWNSWLPPVGMSVRRRDDQGALIG